MKVIWNTLIALVLASTAVAEEASRTPSYLYADSTPSWTNRFKEVASLSPKELAERHRTLLSNPVRDPREAFLCAVNHYRQGQMNKAEELARTAADPDTNIKTNALVLLALTQEKEQSFAEAVSTWKMLARAQPNDPQPRYQAVRTMIAAQQAAEAVAYLENFVKTHPLRTTAHHMLGLAYLDHEVYGLAWRHFARAALQPDAHPDSYVMLAQTSLLTNDSEEAWGWLKKGLEATEKVQQRRAYLTIKLFEELNQFPAYKNMRENLTMPSDLPPDGSGE